MKSPDLDPPDSELKSLFSIDIRSLAFLRIGLGLLILYDLFFRAFDLKAHYTDLGIFPRADLLKSTYYSSLWSIHHIHGSVFVEALLFLITAFFAVLLVAGYQTRLATVVSWFLSVSLFNRAPLIVTGGDTLLRLLLFWSMFIPLGAAFSVDRLLSPLKKIPQSILSKATFAIMMQVFFVYIFTWLHKYRGDEWWPEGTAVYYALSLEYMATPLGLWMREFPPWILRMLTYGVYWFEFLGALLLFLLFKSHTRLVLVGLFIFMQVSFGLGLSLGIFSIVNMLALLVFLPGLFWDILPLHLFKQKIPGFKKIISHLPKRNIRLNLSWLGQFFVLFALSLTLLYNLAHLNQIRFSLPPVLSSTITLLRLNQRWTMFAAKPPKHEGWFVFEGKLKNGTKLDLRTQKPIIWERPEKIYKTFKNYRWRKFMMNIRKKKFKRYRKLYAKYACREWNEKHTSSEKLEKLTMYFMQQKTLPDLKRSEPKKLTLLRHTCR